MIKTFSFLGFAFVVGCIVGGYASYRYLSIDFENKVNEYENAVKQQTLAEMQNTLEKERKFDNDADKIQSDSHALIDVVHNLYASISASGVQHDSQDDPGGAKNVSADPISTDRENKCKCVEVNGAEFQRLYQRQLLISRDCDIDRQHLNTVIDLYNALQTNYN